MKIEEILNEISSKSLEDKKEIDNFTDNFNNSDTIQFNKSTSINNNKTDTTNKNNLSKSALERYTYVRNWEPKTIQLYNLFLNFLKSKKWIVANNHYEVGIQTKRYKLTTAFMRKYPRESWEEYILADRTLIKNRERNFMENKETQKNIIEKILSSKETPTIVKEQLKLLASGRITIVNQEVIKLLRELYYEEGENKTALRSWIDSVENYFRERNIFFHQDDAGRLYTNIVDMKREVRKLLLLDGKPTLEVDWGSAHPNILAHFILIYWNMSETETEQFLNRITQVAYENEEEPFDVFIDEVKRIPADILNTDADELDEETRKLLTFIQNLKSGTMKKKLHNHLKGYYPKITEEESKLMMNAAINRWLFPGMKDTENMTYNYITELFGNIFLPLEMMKVITREREMKKSWNITSKIFRNIESRLMKQVLTKLKDNGITAIWIQDGVRVKKTDADKTKELMEEILNTNFFLKQTANIKS